MKIVFFGTPHFVVPVLETLVKNFEVIGVVTAPDAKMGRKQILTPTHVAQYATEHHIPVFKPEKITNEITKQLADLHPDVFIVAAYGKILPQTILDIPKQGALNIHPSLLPKYRGPSPIQAAILNGETLTGVTIIKMDAEMDHGPIVAATEVLLMLDDTFETLHIRLFIEGANLLNRILPDYLAGKIIPEPQDDTKMSYCHILSRESGFFDINTPPTKDVLSRMVRAFYPWPTAWTIWNKKIVKFLPVKDQIFIQIEGKKAMGVKDFLNGYSQFPLKQQLL